MNVDYNPDDHVVEVTIHTCRFHQEHPGQSYAGCTCGGGYTTRPKTPEEREASRPRTRGETHIEYLITSDALGDWPEIFTDIDDVAYDLAFNQHNYPDVKFEVLERTVTAWTPTEETIPMIEWHDPLENDD